MSCVAIAVFVKESALLVVLSFVGPCRSIFGVLLSFGEGCF